MSTFDIGLSDVTRTLSLALAVIEEDQLAHAIRTTYAAYRIGQALGLGRDSLDLLVQAGQLHDVGLVGHFRELSLAAEESDLVLGHPSRGAKLVRLLPSELTDIHAVAEIVEAHHERWDGRGYPRGLAGTDIPDLAPVLMAADRLEVRFASLPHVWDRSEEVIAWARGLNGTAFRPDVAEALASLCLDLTFLMDLGGPFPMVLYDRLNTGPVVTLDLDGLARVGEALAGMIDHKSPYTASHSLRVAAWARRIAQHLGLAPARIAQIYVAGLLHDLGKLAIPNEILDKPGALSPDEWKVMRTHSYYTRFVLLELRGVEQIGLWGSMHHEKLDGSGYPSRLTAKDIPLEGRIMAVADSFEGITAVRPYHPPMPLEQGVAILDRDAIAGKYDQGVVRALGEVVREGWRPQ